LLLSQVAPFIHLFAAAVGSYEKLRRDIDRESLIDGTSLKGTRLLHPEGTVEFKNVSFAYPSRPEITVLENYDLVIPANKHTALIGLSGSGKSTIAGLATRLYDPNEGQILFDGHDIRELNVFDLRSSISLVQQEAPLLDRSLLENVAHGLINSPDPNHADLKPTLLGTELAEVAKEVRDGDDLTVAAERHGSIVARIVQLVRNAAVLADADDFICALKQGYGTTVGSSGRLISGGQKQRIALARALIKEPRVLILDEATASLDSRSEQRIQRAIANISSGRTMITVAHRLSTITNADNIVVMQKGRLLEQGTHAELMARDGAYAGLIKLQTIGTTEEPTTAIANPDLVPSSDLLNEKAEAISEDQIVDEKAQMTSSQTEPESTEEDELPSPKKSLWDLCRGYAPALKSHLLVIFIALLGSVAVGGAFSGEAVIFGNTVGSLNPCKTPAFIRSHGNFFGLMFFVLAIIEFFANLISWAGFGWTSERLVYTVRVLSFRSLFEQNLEWHQSEGRSPSMLLSYITRDGNALAGLSGSVLGTLFSITVNLFAAIILTHIVAWKIALVCLSLVPLLLGCGLMELTVLGKFEEKHETAYTQSVAIGVEAVTSIKLVAALSLEEETLGTYKRSLVGPRKETFRVILQASFWQAMTYFLGNCVNALSYWWGAKQIIAGNYTQTQFLIVVFSLLVGALLWAQMFALAPELSSARGAMARILSLIEIGSDGMRGHVRDPAIEHRPEDKDVEAIAESKPVHLFDGRPSSVQFSNVHFAYPARPDSKVLNGLDIKVQPGQFCALVGQSGAGKSTIISLIERFYTPQSGSIFVDGVDITKSRDVSFRDTIALVPQESVLFEGTVAFNIGLGSRHSQEATMDEIVEACKLANIHETINDLPDGYNTLCGPNGSQFSGGQKQRLSIARALVRKPKLLILDESTSALDAESEKLLQDSLELVAKQTTVIAIAHRLRTIRKANVIFQIEAGQCFVSGTHEELMLKSETYRENAMHQTV
jgi:ATP-binding cassette subfamily B (MDR/TAP) protein 1